MPEFALCIITFYEESLGYSKVWKQTWPWAIINFYDFVRLSLFLFEILSALDGFSWNIRFRIPPIITLDSEFPKYLPFWRHLSHTRTEM